VARPTLCVTLAAFVAATAPVGSAAAATWVPDAGVSLGSSAGSDICRSAQLAAAAGIPWGSIGIGWGNLEPLPDSYRAPGQPGAAGWAELGDKLRCAKAAGLSIEIRVADAPEWASGRSGISNDAPTAQNVPAFAEFMRDLATTYGGMIDAYSPWNEPNIRNFWDPPDAVAYTNLQKQAYIAVKAADPTALVLSAPLAGLSFSDPAKGAYTFIENAYKAGLAGYADIIGWNAYPALTPEAEPTDQQGRPTPSSLNGQRHLRTIIDRYDPGRPIWLMEHSWSTCTSCTPGGVNTATEAVQADYLVRAFTYRRRYLAGSTDRIFWYTLRDSSTNKSRWEDNQGLLRFDWSPKPAYAAFAAISVPRPPGATAPPGSTATEPAPNPGGLAAPQLPPAAALSPLPNQVVSGNERLRLGRLRLRFDGAKIVVSTRVATTAPVRLIVEGYSTLRWKRITTVKVATAGRVALSIPDAGYLGIRIRARLASASRWQVARVARVPRPSGTRAQR
jgi:hypothetical protein